MAQWKRVGPISQRSEDRNLLPANLFIFNYLILIPIMNGISKICALYINKCVTLM